MLGPLVSDFLPVGQGVERSGEKTGFRDLQQWTRQDRQVKGPSWGQGFQGRATPITAVESALFQKEDRQSKLTAEVFLFLTS